MAWRVQIDAVNMLRRMKWHTGFTADEIEESADEVVIRESSVADLPSEADVLQVCLPAKVAYFLMHQMKLFAPL
jgi:hypothetical protein